MPRRSLMEILRISLVRLWVRGQLEVLLPQPEIDYCYLSSGYMFPRRDGIILGGTWDHNDWSLAPNPEQTTAILEGHAEIMKGLKG